MGNSEPVQLQSSVDPSKHTYFSQTSSSKNRIINSASEPNKTTICPYDNGPSGTHINKNSYEKATSSKENLSFKKTAQYEQNYSTFSSTLFGTGYKKEKGLRKEKSSSLKKTTTTSQTHFSTGETQVPDNNTDYSISQSSKKKVRFEPGSLNENTPLINNTTHRPGPISTATGLPVPPCNNETLLPFIRSKLPLWGWILLGVLFFLGNLIILAVLFTNNTQSQGVIEQLLSNIDYELIESDLNYFKAISFNSSDMNGLKYSSGVHSKNIENKLSSKLSGAFYIKEQLSKLLRFKTETQPFAKPTWHLTSTPIMTLYIEENVFLEYKKDFVVMPFSGNYHYHRHMRVHPVTPISCSLYHYDLSHKAAILPYPSGKTAGIGVPTTCSEWDLVYSAQQAGARAVIFYQVEYEKLPEFDMFQPPKLLPTGWRPGGAMINIPVIVVGRLIGEILLSTRLYKVDLITNTAFQVENSYNIVARLSQKNSNIMTKSPFILGSHWDFDPTFSQNETSDFPSDYPSDYPVTGAVGLLAIARALDQSKVLPTDRPIYLVWFGERFPLTLGVKAFIDDLWLNNLENYMAYFYLDLANLNGNVPQIQNSDDAPEHLRPISQNTQSSIERIISFEYDQFRRSNHREKIPVYDLNSVTGEPSLLFNQFGIPTSGLSSILSSKSYFSQEENVDQLTEVALITLGTLNNLSNGNI